MTMNRTARRLGIPPRKTGGSQAAQTLAQVLADLQATRVQTALSNAARAEQQQILLAEMADKIGTKWVGADKARAA